ncbi:MAG: hypothetical protein K2L85_05835 [Paramuribaculum sp.]|nr:hypothetical protein [Paramuribaculum sp.]
MNHRMTPFVPVLIMLSIIVSFSACNNRRAVAKFPKQALYSNDYSPYSNRSDNNKRLKTGNVYLTVSRDTVFLHDGSFVLNEDGTCWQSGRYSGLYQIVGDSLFMQYYTVLTGYYTSSIFQYWDVRLYRCKIIDSSSFTISQSSTFIGPDLTPIGPFYFNSDSDATCMQYYPLENPLHVNQAANILNQKWIWKDKKEWKAWKKAQKAKKKKRKKESLE